jgi:hypothetical protein
MMMMMDPDDEMTYRERESKITRVFVFIREGRRCSKANTA